MKIFNRHQWACDYLSMQGLTLTLNMVSSWKATSLPLRCHCLLKIYISTLNCFLNRSAKMIYKYSVFNHVSVVSYFGLVFTPWLLSVRSTPTNISLCINEKTQYPCRNGSPTECRVDVELNLLQFSKSIPVICSTWPVSSSDFKWMQISKAIFTTAC